jgi:putative SOS response-associated peptidase YedK
VKEFVGESFVVNQFMRQYHVNGYAHPQLPVITNADAKHVVTMQWGLIPGWTKNAEGAEAIQDKTLNATCEGVFEKPAFKSSIRFNRCVVLVDGFYEWQHKGKTKLPYYIFAANGQILPLGGLWAEWTDTDTGEVLESCTIITTPANELMAQIHNVKKRMPLIIDHDQASRWLDDQLGEEEIRKMMVPCADGLLKAKNIDSLITSTKKNTNVPEVQRIAPFQGDLFDQ